MIIPLMSQLPLQFANVRWSKVNHSHVVVFLCSVQQLIPFVEDDGSKHDDRPGGQSRSAAEDRREITEVNKVLCVLCVLWGPRRTRL